MAANDYTYPRIPKHTDLSVGNQGVSDIAAGLCVTLDGANIVPTTAEDNVVLSSADDTIYGVAVETLKAGGGVGRVAAGDGEIVVCKASGAITAGGWVQADNNGKVKAQVDAKPTVGVALTTTLADGDYLRVKLHIARNK